MRYDRSQVRKIVVETMKLHPKGCTFKTNAIELIVEQTMHNAGDSKASFVIACDKAFEDAELACPAHNGLPDMNRMPLI